MLVALLAPYVDGTRTRGAAPAAVVALGGLALLEPWRTDGAWLLGATLGLVSAVGYAGNVFFARRLTLAVGAARTMCVHSALAAVLLAPLAVPDLGAIEARDLAVLGAGTLVLGTGAGLAYLHGLAIIGAARAAMLTFCEPIVAVVVGVVVWGEPLRAPAAAGAALVLGAGAYVIGANRPVRPVEVAPAAVGG
ncbi:MAG: EamA family transporter [Kofleriaceae bacterium]